MTSTLPAPLTDGPVKVLLLAVGGTVAARMVSGLVDRVLVHELERCCLDSVHDAGTARHAISVFTSSAVLLLISLWQAGHLGKGDVRAGIGDRTISAKGLFLALWSALVLYNLLYQAVLMYRYPGLAQISPSTELGYLFIDLLPTILFVPICEEVFFRGWLWNALQQYWGPVTIGTIVSVIWIAGHLPFGYHRLILLAPNAALLAITRHYTRSIRAPILLHITTNAFALLGLPLCNLIFSGAGRALVPSL